MSKHLFSTIIAFIVVSYSTSLFGQTSSDASFAVYNKKTGRPQYLVYASSVVKSGDYLKLKDVKIDIIRPKLKDLSTISPINKLNIYDINSSKASVLKFWLQIPHSQGIIQAPTAAYSETFQLIKGEGPIHLRTPALDIDGVGFETDNNNSTLWIKNKVKVIFRFGMNNKLTKLAGAKK